MQLKPTASVLVLHGYSDVPPKSGTFREFHALVTNSWREHGITQTYFGAQGPGYSDDYTKIGGRAYRRLIASDFDGIHELSLAANPLTSDAPSYDSFAMASLGYVEAYREMLLCLTINEAFVPIRSRDFDSITGLALALTKWDFGYGFADEVSRKPELFAMGMNSGMLSRAEERQLEAWYAAPSDVRIARLRDVFPYNVVNASQLEQEIQSGESLRTFIERDPDFTLTRVDGLFKWIIPTDEAVSRVRQMLRDSAVLIR